MLATGNDDYRDFLREVFRKRVYKCLASGYSKHISADNDKLLALGLHNGKFDTNSMLMLQVKYCNFWEKNSYSFAKVLIAGNYSISYQSIMSVVYIAYNTFS